MKVWRIEDGKGHGVCQHSGSELCEKYRSCVKRHKCYGIDTSLQDEIEWASNAVDYRFGFTSINEVRGYFPAQLGREKMKEDGGQLWEYEVEKLLKHNTGQCVFDLADAKKIKQWDLVTLVEVEDGSVA